MNLGLITAEDYDIMRRRFLGLDDADCLDVHFVLAFVLLFVYKKKS